MMERASPAVLLLARRGGVQAVAKAIGDALFFGSGMRFSARDLKAEPNASTALP
jgi:hypothetical protein